MESTNQQFLERWSLPNRFNQEDKTKKSFLIAFFQKYEKQIQNKHPKTLSFLIKEKFNRNITAQYIKDYQQGERRAMKQM